MLSLSVSHDSVRLALVKIGARLVAPEASPELKSEGHMSSSPDELKTKNFF